MTDDASARRDAGLRRMGRLTRWVAAGAVALTGTLSVVAARAFPGSASSTSTASTTSTPGIAAQDSTSATTPTTSASSDDGTAVLQAPASAPSSSRRASHVTSGGS